MLKNFAKLKKYVSKCIPELIAEKELDARITPWVVKFNKIPNLCTIESCEGNKAGDPYLAIVLNSDRAINEWEDIEDTKVVTDKGILCSQEKEYGLIDYYIFYFSRENFDKNLEKIYNRCKEITEKL